MHRRLKKAPDLCAEDIGLGINFDFRPGYGGTSIDSADEMLRYRGKITNVIDMYSDHIVELSAEDGVDEYQLLLGAQQRF